MKKIIFDDPFIKKNYVKDDYIYDKNNQILFLNNIIDNIDFSYNDFIIKDIKKKFSSYKSQDKQKKRYDDEQHITYEELLIKLKNSELKCFYCKNDVVLIYKNKKEKNQWSLERFNNLLGHYNSNTCISCLECNLKRRNENYEHFKWSKQLNILKKN
tara:strand:- start:102 stop:572 length:471 start_codon:yes stop_codon:yes gene_type:complete